MSWSRSCLWNGRRRRGDDDPVPGRARGIAEAAVGLADHDRAGEVRCQGFETLARERDQRRLALERGDVSAQPGKDRRLVAGSGADLEDPVAWRDLEAFGHLGHHQRLADRLATFDRKCSVGVCVATAGIGDEGLARDRTHRGEDALIRDAALAQLGLDHRRARLLGVLRRTGHDLEDTPHGRPPRSGACSGRRSRYGRRRRWGRRWRSARGRRGRRTRMTTVRRSPRLPARCSVLR